MAINRTAVENVSQIMTEKYDARVMRTLTLMRSTLYSLIHKRGKGSMVKNYSTSLAKIVIGSRYGVPGGVFSTTSAGAFGTVNTGTTTRKFTLVPFELWAAIRMDSRLINGNKDELLVNEVVEQVDLTTSNAARTLNRLMAGDGSGKLATTTGPATAEGTLANHYWVPVNDTSCVSNLQHVDVYTAAGAKVAVGQVVGAKVPFGAGDLLIDFGASVSTVDAGGGIFVQNTYGKSIIHGLGDLISATRDFLDIESENGVARTDARNYMYRSPVLDAADIDNAGNAFTGEAHELVEIMIDSLRMGGGNVKSFSDGYGQQVKAATSYMVMHPDVIRAISRSLRDQNRYMGEITVDGGFTLSTFDGVPMLHEPDCASGSGFAINSQDWMTFDTPPKWAKGTDGLFQREVGTSNYEAACSMLVQTFTDNPRGQGKFVNFPVGTFKTAFRPQ